MPGGGRGRSSRDPRQVARAAGTIRRHADLDIRGDYLIP